MWYYTKMGALRSIGNSSSEQQQEKATLKTDEVVKNMIVLTVVQKREK
jgi:hypothetical protein